MLGSDPGIDFIQFFVPTAVSNDNSLEKEADAPTRVTGGWGQGSASGHSDPVASARFTPSDRGLTPVQGTRGGPMRQ